MNGSGTMNYGDFVEQVARAHARIATGNDRLVGLREVLVELALPDEAENAVWTALKDLEALGIVEIDSVHWVKPTQATRAIRSGASLRELWPKIVGEFLDEEQASFLAALVELAHRPGGQFADVEWTSVDDVYDRLGWDKADHEPYALTESLSDLGAIRRDARMGGYIAVHPTYRGLVRITERHSTEWQVRLANLVEEWETVSVEFKRELRLGTSKTNSEFARDILALVTTKASGRERFLIVGFDDRTHEFAQPWSSETSLERLEQILDVFCDPMPEIHLTLFEHESGRGNVGIITVRRDPAKLVYRMAKSEGKIAEGDVFVRHGSHVVHPDEDELADLVSEGRRARGEQ
jgi:hypothetical protein